MLKNLSTSSRYRGFTPTPKKFGVTLRSKGGFTLIELLIVIAIIGLLTTVITVSLVSARRKARDAKRVADLTQFQKAMEMFHSTYDTYKPTGCATAGTKVSACTGAGSAGLVDFIGNIANLKDPSGTNPCNNPATEVCDYTFGTAATATTYLVNFWLEGSTGSLPAGAHTLTEAGVQ